MENGQDPLGATEVAQIDPTKEYELPGGVKILGKDLVGGGLRQADYSRKTMELAEERRQLAAIQPEVQALAEKAARLEGFVNGDPEIYQKYVHVVEGKPIPVQDRSGQRTEKKVEAVAPPQRIPHYDAEIRRLSDEQLALKGDQEIRAFADSQGLQYDFVTQNLLSIAATKYNPMLPATERLGMALNAYKGEHAEEFAKNRFADRMAASTFGGAQHSPGGQGDSLESRVEAEKQRLFGDKKDMSFLTD